MISRVLPFLLMSLLALAAVAPPAAAAPVLTADRPCYATDHDDVITFRGTGFTPGGDVSVLLRGDHAGLGAWGVADGSGAIETGGSVPWLTALGYAETVHRAEVTATAVDLGRADPAASAVQDAFASTTITITDWAMLVAAWEGTSGVALAHPRSYTTFAAIGWTWVHGTPLYAHYVLGGRLVRTVRLMVPSGACGDATARLRQFPFRPVRAGTYRVLFSSHRRFPAPGWYAYYAKVRVLPRDAVR